MARTSIGLDVGTRAVRAVELRRSGGQMNVVRFGRVLLPDGAVDHGEVQDSAAVSRAIQALWKRLKLTNRSVHVGMANRRVVVRVVELPSMALDDLDGAIKLQAQDHIPIPLSEALMDYEVLDEVQGSDGRQLQRVLVVAAERASVEPLIEAVQGAKLEPITIELNSYPLIRCLGNTSGQAEAIVDIGAGITNVVIHLGGRIRFTRILPNFGGDDFTSAIAEGLGMSTEEAEATKRRSGAELADRMRGSVVGTSEETFGGSDEGAGGVAVATSASDFMEPILQRLVSEIRGSIDFYTAQPDAVPVERVVLTGGGSLLGGLSESIESSLDVRSEVGHPFERVHLGKMKVPDEQMDLAERYLSVAVGLAMAGTGS